LEKFKSFITEAKEEPYRILVVSSGALRSVNKKVVPKFHTSKRFEEEAKKAGHEIYILQVETAYITFEDDIYKIYNKDDKKGFEVNKDTVAIVRGTVRLKKSWLDLLSRLEKIGVCMVNSRETVEISSDKYRSYVKLQDFGLTQPKTVLLSSQETWKQSLETLDSKFPIIMKTLEGSKGVGVLFIESERQMESIIQLLFNQNEDIDLLIQEYIETDGDIRVIVLGGKVIASMKRDVIKGDFRSNVSQGAKVKEYKLTELELEQCLLAAKAIDGSWTAVDFIPSKNPKKDPPYILEVNHSPGTEGIEEATNDNIVKKVVDFYKNPKNRYTVPTQIGYLETIKIEPFGDIIAKFDTGNSALAPTIHADEVSVKGKVVTWKYNGVSLKSKLIKITDVHVGGLNDYTEKRYTVLLDIEFAGSLYKNQEVMLDDRSDREPVLFNRKLMRQMNVMVNPQRKYIVTTKFTLDK
jgi:ribosomal protein S6--L-glutamate ligase